jgi:hypothetical protein
VNDKNKEDLRDVMTGETRRGRRPIDLETIRRKRERDELLLTRTTHSLCAF